jgi:glucokinase
MSSEIVAPTATPALVAGTGDARHLRRLNLERLLSAAMERGAPFSRGELIQATSLSAPTVGSLTSELIRTGLLRDLGVGPSRGGRRPDFMEFNAQYGYVVGVALGATRTQLALADLRGERLTHRVMATPAGLGPPAMVARLATWIRALLKDADVPKEKLVGVAAGVPGAVDHDRGLVLALTPNLKGWTQVPLASSLERALGTPVTVENDVNLAVLGERWRGVGQGHDTCVFFHVGTGIGAGIVVGGELHRGHHYLAGEIGLMCMGPQYIEQDFGAQGCLESLAGLKSLATRWGGAGKAGGKRAVAALFQAAESGDPKVRRMLAEAASLVGIAVTNVSLALDPSLVVLGGALPAENEGFVEGVRRVVTRVIPSPPEIAVSKLGREATLWGSLLMATTQAHSLLRERLRRTGLAR